MISEAQQQLMNVIPPRRGNVIALTVDSTARPYDTTVLAFGGRNYRSDLAADALYITLQAVGVDIYYYFDSVTNSDLDNTAKISAGGTLAYATTYGAVLPAGNSQDMRISRTVDQFLTVKAASTSGTLIFFASSQPFAGSP